jgi:PucR family transcriptional regulator, purine catabolism regulatory protein
MADTGALPDAVGLPLRQVLQLDTLRDPPVLAGASGLDRIVTRLNVMEVPDILPWVKPDELLLTTAYPLRDDPDRLTGLVESLDAHGLAGMGIKLGRYVDALPRRALRRADELGFPIVLLPDGVGFDEILDQVLGEILNTRATRLAQRDELHRTFLQRLLAGATIGELVEIVGATFGGPAALLDHDGFVIAASGLDAVTDRLADAGLLLPDGAIALSEHPGGVAMARGASLAHLCVRVSAGAQHFGRLVAFEGRRPLRDGDVGDLEVAATVLALASQTQAAVVRVEQRYRVDVLADLLSPDESARARARRQAEGLGWLLDRDAVVVVAAPDGDVRPDAVSTQRFVANLARWVRADDPQALVAEHDGHVVVVAASPPVTLDHVRTWAREARSSCSHSFGVSRTATDADALVVAHGQAVRAASIGRQAGGDGLVTHFDDLGALRLLCLIPDVDELTSFLRDVLGPLADDTPEAAELRYTLQVLVETNCNLAESARRMYFHYNTMRYRLERLKAIVGPFTDDPRLRLDVALALAIARLTADPERRTPRRG